jgi:hypothetical protein
MLPADLGLEQRGYDSALIYLATFGAVKENPDGEIVAKVFEPMLGTGRCKQNVRRFESLSSTFTKEFTAALRHDVNLIARVRCLRIVTTRGIQFDNEGTVFEQSDRAFALGTWQAIQPLAQIDQATGIGVCHGDDANNTLEWPRGCIVSASFCHLTRVK